MFFAMLSVVFPYKKVVLCFLLPGHSHNIADRVIAWCRGATRKMNIYTPSLAVDEVNKVKSVHGVFLNHNDPSHPFYVGWGDLLDKYFKAPPACYTANYLFEIDQGVCTARKTVDTPDENAIVFEMVDPNSTDSIRKAVIKGLFDQAVSTIWEASVRNVQLPRHQTKELTEKKMKSLSAKYFSIPPQHLHYYPSVPDAVANAPVQSADQTDETTTTPSNPKSKRKPGRPRKQKNKLKPNQPSILQFFSPAKQ
ncbi:hypothetical protein PR001_g911 [Phytophthora rubi]|uniref:Uncharacterized protein n=2 Tax=Phytophthora rubi TaxID=129364 RepID=A0A6A3PAU0_9STRA|nr:hypothetical protein PR001_g911 [Phytophthora rubi]